MDVKEFEFSYSIRKEATTTKRKKHKDEFIKRSGFNMRERERVFKFNEEEWRNTTQVVFKWLRQLKINYANKGRVITK